jgi:hypothetical protein
MNDLCSNHAELYIMDPQCTHYVLPLLLSISLITILGFIFRYNLDFPSLIFKNVGTSFHHRSIILGGGAVSGTAP